MAAESFSSELVRQLEMFSIQSRRRFLGDRQGSHRSLRRGHGLEFSDYRMYEMGDNPRHIDWAVYGRTDRLYVKRFLEEENLHVVVLLDGSRSMRTDVEGIKWRFSKLCAMSAAYVALMQHDPATVRVLGGAGTPKLRGVREFSIVESVCDAASEIDPDLTSALRTAATSIRLPGVVLLVSDLMYPIELIDQSLRLLRARNIELCIVHVLGHSDVDPLRPGESATVVDSETGEEASLEYSDESAGEYARALAGHLDAVRRMCRETGTKYYLANPRTGDDAEILTALSQAGLFR